MKSNPEILLYQTEDGRTKLEVRLEDETVWITIDQMAELFQKSRSTINEHILNIFKEGELKEEDVKRKIVISDFSTKPTNLYNLDVIISVGYRVKSLRGTQFRIWATERLREYLVKDFTMNDALLKTGAGYFEELLERIRDIRSSEKVFYRKVLEIMLPAWTMIPVQQAQNCFFRQCKTNCIGRCMATQPLRLSFSGRMPNSHLWDLLLLKALSPPNRKFQWPRTT